MSRWSTKTAVILKKLGQTSAYEWKWNITARHHLTGTILSKGTIAPEPSRDVCMRCTGVSMGILTSLRLCSTYTTNWCCVFWHLFIRTRVNFFSSLSHRSWSVGPDHMGPPLPTCISEPWLPMTLSSVLHCSFLGPLRQILATAEREHPTWVRFWPSRLALVKLTQTLTLPIFSCFYYYNMAY